MLLDGQVAVVSGVGPGVGRELSRLFAREGAAVVLVARDETKLRDVADEIKAGGGRALFIPCDIADAAQCTEVARRSIDTFGGVDVLINNAFQMGPWSPLMDTALDAAWSAPFEVNVKGTLQMTQALLPSLESRRGSVVMVNTVAMRTHKPDVGCYAISKGALQTATRYLSVELAGRGVRVNAVIPGYIDGPPLQDAFGRMALASGRTSDDLRKEITESLPLKRIPTSLDVAEAILFFASRKSQSITGAALDINGGEFIPQ